jgi:hypothetical protein
VYISVFTQIMEDEEVQNRISNDQAELIAFALRGIDFQLAELEQKRAELLGQTDSSTPSASANASSAPTNGGRTRKRRVITAAHRAKLRAAAKKRWANARAAKK